MEDKRTHARLELEGYNVHCKMLYAPEVQLRDLSLGGGRMLSPKRLHMGSEYSFVLSCNGGSRTLKGVVIWEKLASLEKQKNGDAVAEYEMGIRFGEILTGAGEELLNFISTHAEQQKEALRLMGTRTRLVDAPNGPPVQVRATREYLVQRLSLGGLQVRSTHRQRPGSQYRMEMALVEKDPPIAFEGKVVYCHPIGDGDGYNVGIQFLELAERDRGRLADFLDILIAR